MGTQPDSAVVALAGDAARLAHEWDSLSLFRKRRLRNVAPEIAAALDLASASAYAADRGAARRTPVWTPFANAFGGGRK